MNIRDPQVVASNKPFRQSINIVDACINAEPHVCVCYQRVPVNEITQSFTIIIHETSPLAIIHETSPLAQLVSLDMIKSHFRKNHVSKNPGCLYTSRYWFFLNLNSS